MQKSTVRSLPRITLPLVWGYLLLAVHAVAEPEFVTHRLNPQSEFSACAIFDVDNDGRVDIYCGGFWYRAPKWERFRTRDVPKIRGRFDDYSNLPIDVNADGWTDVVSVNYRSKSIFWSRNPGAQGGDWITETVDQPGPSETGRLYDIDGDGRLDLLPNGTKFAAWYELLPRKAQWQRHALPDGVAGHGVGFGDVNGDGRGDIVTANGWFEAPIDRKNGRWTQHAEYALPRDCSVPILVLDVDQDGDSDLVFGRGHDIGVYWCEQRASSGKREWVIHPIDTSWSSAHSLLVADLDGDGIDEVIAGKRFWGHDGKDPGEWDPLVIYSYQFSNGVWRRTRLTDALGAGFDLDPSCADIDGDGDIDVVAPTRKGLYVIENLRLGRRQDMTVGKPVEHPKYVTSASLLSIEENGQRSRIDDTVGWGRKRQQLLRSFEVVMGDLPEPTSRVPLDVEVESQEQCDGYLRIKLTYQAEPDDRVPAFLLIPDGDPLRARPAMLCLHPTHVLGKAQICGLGGKPSRFYAHELAQRGFVCLVPDYPSFGDYQYDFSRAGRHASGTMKAIWNNIRGVDLLESRGEVDRDRIGCIGHSLGGHNALFTAAFDQRIRAVVTSCGFTCFARYYGGDLTGWTSARYMPRIESEFGKEPRQMPFDFHEVLGAIAPRPIYVSAPVHDSNFNNLGVREVVQRVRPVYELFGKGELRAVYPESGHDFPQSVREDSYEWLSEKLK